MVNVLFALPQDNIGTSLNVGINDVTKMKRHRNIRSTSPSNTVMEIKIAMDEGLILDSERDKERIELARLNGI